MRKLRDLDGDPLVERAAALLRAVEPKPESPERMARIRRELEAHPRIAPGPTVKPAAWIGTGCLLVAAAGAAAGHLGSRAAPSKDPRAEEPPVRTTVKPARRGAPAAAVVATTSAAPTVQSSAIDAAGGGGAGSSHSASAFPPPRRDADRVMTSDGSASARAAEAALVHAAVKALRRERDPEKAARLLARYGARDPSGPLAEEALALRIEAATARRDPGARTWAQEYMTRYPNGRYRDAAEQALAGPR